MSPSTQLAEALLGPKIRATASTHRGILVCSLIFPRQFGVVQPTSIAQRSGSIRSPSPLGRFGTIAAVAASWWCGPPSTLLSVATCETASLTIIAFLLAGIALRLMGRLVERFVVALICCLLFVDCLLGKDDISNFKKRVQLDTGLGNHIVNFDNPRQRGHGGTGALCVMHSVAITTGEIAQNATRRGNLNEH